MPDGAIPRSDLLIVGGGLAATALVAALRRADWAGGITVLAAETLMPYDRPPLSKELFARERPADLAPQLGLADDAATWRLGHTAVAIAESDDAVTVTTHTPGGAWAHFAATHAVVATGSLAWRAPEWRGVHTLSTWPDAVALRAALTASSSLVVIGAGWIGLEVASAASARGLEVAMVEVTGRPLGALLPAEITSRISAWLDEAGVRIVPGGRVVRATAGAVELEDGRTEAADVVFSGVGARPSTSWLPAAWLDESGHVRVDVSGRATMARRVWAIGDCAAVDGIVDQHWNAAVAAAERCAHALLGLEVPEPRPPMVFSTLFGHELNLVGQARPDAVVEWRSAQSPGWSALLLGDGELLAGVAADRAREVGELRRALRRDAARR